MRRLAAVLLVAVLAWFTSAAAAVPVVAAGSASFLYPVHNQRFGFKVVMVEDHTGNAWPVHAAQGAWEAGTDVSVRYGTCVSTAGCVRVYEGSFGRTGWVGQTFADWNDAGVYTSWVRINLNNSYSMNATQHQTAASHELGHALGLMYHRTLKGSCMYFRVDPDVNPWPAQADKDVLNGRY